MNSLFSDESRLAFEKPTACEHRHGLQFLFFNILSTDSVARHTISIYLYMCIRGKARWMHTKRETKKEKINR